MKDKIAFVKEYLLLILAGALLFISVLVSFSVKIMNVFVDGLLIVLALYFVHQFLTDRKKKDKPF